MRAAPILALSFALSGCNTGLYAAQGGWTPIFRNGMRVLLEEPDLELAKLGLAGDMKLIESTAATFPSDRELLSLAARARASYAFLFLEDELEEASLLYAADEARVDRARARVLSCHAKGREYAERALRLNAAYFEIVGERRLEEISPADLQLALDALEPTDASPLFWLTLSWGSQLRVKPEPADLTQLPKVMRMMERVLVLDDEVVHGLGPHLFAGILFGFRSKAMGGDPERARHHFERARALDGVMLAEVLHAQMIEDHPDRVLESIIVAKPRREVALLEEVAKNKACRMLRRRAGAVSYRCRTTDP